MSHQPGGRTLVVAGVTGAAERVDHGLPVGVEHGAGGAQLRLNISRAAATRRLASIGLLASMHSTSSWNSGIGCVLEPDAGLIGVGRARLVEQTAYASSSVSVISVTIGAGTPGDVANAVYFGGSPLA